ncbi:MAG: hypothetical protein NZM25_09245 [Leptospiraceae bacterium]|nr:hypothetical protein [Leptospiraceae bacterium]MDW8307324.1 hypothetical protein [Leptospiraceae bacterium]
MEIIALSLFLLGTTLVAVGFLLSPKTESQKPQPVLQEAQARTDRGNDSVQVRIEKENPRFFRKTAYLYYDNSGESQNPKTQGKITTNALADIRRVGKGELSYDGVALYFEQESSRRSFPLASLEELLFYPNCVILVPKEKAPIPLIFLDETDSLRRLIETLRKDHAV